MTISHEHASKTGCFTTILHRFLCTGGLPTHPSSDTGSPKNESTPIKPPSPTRTTTPAGLVARLMGLDSFPNSPKVTNTTMQKSRSVGSLDFLPNFNITKQPAFNRRVTTSLSFREVPTTFLHDVSKSDVGLSPITRKSNTLSEKVGFDTNMKKNKNHIIKKHQSQSQHEVASVPMKSMKMRRRRVVNGAKKKVADDGFPEGKKRYKSRSKTYNHALPKMGKHDVRKEKKKSRLKRIECGYSEDYCINVLKEVCRLTMGEIEGGVWLYTKVVSNNIQEVSYEIGQYILQVLMYELVDELCSSL